MTPLALTANEVTILVWFPLVDEISHAPGNTAETSTTFELDTVSVTEVRHDDAAKMTSDTRARTV